MARTGSRCPPPPFVLQRGQLQLGALVEEGHAQVLSKPSVLVLDGRQARIQIGQQVPVSKAVAAGQAVATGIDYLTLLDFVDVLSRHPLPIGRTPAQRQRIAASLGKPA